MPLTLVCPTQVLDEHLTVRVHDLADDEILKSVDFILDHCFDLPLVDRIGCLLVEVFLNRFDDGGYELKQVLPKHRLYPAHIVADRLLGTVSFELLLACGLLTDVFNRVEGLLHLLPEFWRKIIIIEGLCRLKHSVVRASEGCLWKLLAWQRQVHLS